MKLREVIPGEAEFEQIRLERGDIILLRSGSTSDVGENLHEIAAQLSPLLPPGVVVIVLPFDSTLDLLSPDELEEAARVARAEAETT